MNKQANKQTNKQNSFVRSANNRDSLHISLLMFSLPPWISDVLAIFKRNSLTPFLPHSHTHTHTHTRLKVVPAQCLNTRAYKTPGQDIVLREEICFYVNDSFVLEKEYKYEYDFCLMTGKNKLLCIQLSKKTVRAIHNHKEEEEEEERRFNVEATTPIKEE